ncbi:GMC family oxidoreductase [Massilia sp. GCM10020059]|uniref:Choline dehydrogenase n=1 Tax=Massilia agrisoli TaxID=2892444 RepID=A0ABS8INR5_9BURK|nr:choline dehydrogenase [Massilia agrisoli]MCC6069432.1 choline dehydrogenase [Massilia agrisoli]
MYDFVIVGGGSAGCVLANRLSADPAIRVCLLEAGPRDSSPFIRMPLGLVRMMMSKKLNWHYFTTPQAELEGRRLFMPRGKTLGGSSATNAMIYTRGHASDYDHWAALGNRGWSYADVLPLFMRSEHYEDGPGPFHGSGGPLNVARLRSPNLLSRTFIDAAAQTGYRLNPDFNGPTQEGVNCYAVTQKDGQRWSAAHAFLHPASGRPNLDVMTHALASQVVFEGGRAAGVAYLRHGKKATVQARREVLLAGGAINSPQLLMLSGIGPPDELARHGIALRHAVPGVGRNLQDHLDALVVHQCSKPVSLGISLATLPSLVRHGFDYLRHRRGPLTSNSAECGGFASSAPGVAVPDLQFHFTPARLDGHARTLRSALFTLLGHGYALHVCSLRPRSRGRITLASAEPSAAPLIDPCYLADPADLPLMVAGVKAARRLLAAQAFDPYRGREIFPGPQVQTDHDIAQFIRRKAETIYHPVGTCKMGHDAMAVVDDTLRVRGVAGLRVVDASIMPTLIGGNTNAPTIMIAEKAAELILGGAASPVD